MSRYSNDHTLRRDAESAQLVRQRIERDTPRCGVCGKPSTTAVCGRCVVVVGRR